MTSCDGVLCEHSFSMRYLIFQWRSLVGYKCPDPGPDCRSLVSILKHTSTLIAESITMSVEKAGYPDNKRSVRGYDFEWTDKHYTAEELMPLRHQADDLALAVVERLFAIIAAQNPEKGAKRPDLYELLKENYPHDDVLRQFWEETHTVPDWVDWEEIEKGQAFLYRYLAPNITGIVLQGCLGENAVCSISPSYHSLYALC